MDWSIRNICKQAYNHRGLIILLIGSLYMILFMVFFELVTLGMLTTYIQSGVPIATNIQNLNTLVIFCAIGVGGLLLSFSPYPYFRLSRFSYVYSIGINLMVLLGLATLLTVYAIEVHYAIPQLAVTCLSYGAVLGVVYAILKLIDFALPSFKRNRNGTRRKPATSPVS